MMPGRFFLGVGSGENLNEHVLGARWPLPDERLEMLEEAIEVMRLLWQGGEQTHRGRHYTVDHARVYTLPEQRVEVYVAAAQTKAASLAGRIGDGLISTAPDADLVTTFEQAGGKGRQKLGMMHCAYDKDRSKGPRACDEGVAEPRPEGTARPGARDAVRLRGSGGDGGRAGCRRVDAVRA